MKVSLLVSRRLPTLGDVNKRAREHFWSFRLLPAANNAHTAAVQ